MGIRIWHQSMTDLTLLPGYAGMLHDHARRICGADTVVDLHGLAPGTYPQGMAPIELVRYRWGEHLAFVQIVENCMRAEREGYDAVDGTPVLDSYGSLLAFAEMLVQLRRRSGLSVGRRGAYAKPPESLVRHLRRMTVGALQDSEARPAP